MAQVIPAVWRNGSEPLRSGERTAVPGYYNCFSMADPHAALADFVWFISQCEQGKTHLRTELEKEFLV